MQYIKSLDGLRALAIILVILFHFYFVLEIGWIGVQIFFVLSGFLITSILLQSKELPFAHYIKRFYWRRSLRIFPLYFLYLFLTSIIYFIVAQPEGFPLKIPYLLSYTFNFFPLIYGYDYDGLFTHMWSLAVEEQFYLIWPFIIYFLSPRQLRKTVIGIIIITPFLRYLFGGFLAPSFPEEKELGEILYRLTFSHFDAFAVGALIPLFKLNEKIIFKKALFIGLSFIILLIGVVNYFDIVSSDNAVTISSLGYPIAGMKNFQHVWSYTLLNFWTCAFILYIAYPELTQKSLFLQVMESRFFALVGRLSYGMYIFHWVILAVHKKFIHDFIGNAFLSFCLYFSIVLVVSYLSFEMFEKKLLLLKDVKWASLSALRFKSK